MKYFLLILLFIGQFKLSISQTLPPQQVYKSSVDYLHKNIFANLPDSWSSEYVEILATHKKDKIPEYEKQTLDLAKKYINNVINPIHNTPNWFNVDSAYFYYPLDYQQIHYDSWLWKLTPRDFSGYKGLIPQSYTHSNLRMPCYTIYDYKLPCEQDTSLLNDIMTIYYSFLYSNESKNKDTLTDKEISRIYGDVVGKIDRVKDDVFKILLLYQLELFIYTNNNSRWSTHYFFDVRLKKIEDCIYNIDPYRQVETYYFIGRMISDLRLGFETYKYRYKYSYKAYYTSIKYKENLDYGIFGFYNMNYLLSMNNDNYYFRNKRLNLTATAMPVFSKSSISDSVNMTALKYLAIIYNINNDSIVCPDPLLRKDISKYTFYELVRLLNFAQENKILLHDRIATICHYEIGNTMREMYNNNFMAITYNGVSVANSFYNHEFSHQFIEPMGNMVDALFSIGNYDDARRIINTMLYYSNELNSNNYIGCSLVKYITYYAAIDNKDSVYYVKSLIDTLLYHNELSSRTIYYNYIPALQNIKKWYNDTSLTAEINRINTFRQTDYTIDYSSYTTAEQEAKDEVNEMENKKILASQKDYEKEFEKKILKDTIRLRDKALDIKTRELTALNNNIKLVKQQLEDTSQALSNASNRLISINKIRDSLIENNDTLIAISNRLSLDTAQKRKEIANLNESIILSNESAEFWSKAFGISTVILAFALILLIASQKFRSGFVQKRLLYHQQKNDNSALVSKLNIIDLYLNGLIPNDTSEQELVNNLQNKLSDLKSYISAIFNYQRSTIVNSMKRKIPLNKEIDNIEKYVELSRYSYKKEIELKIDPALRKLSSNIKIPSNILQPIVENAIKHGFSNRDTNNIIEINLVNKGTNHILCIEDNGHGFNPNKLKKTSNLFVFLNNMFDFRRKNDIDEDQSVSLNDIVYYLLLLKIQLVTTIGFSLAKNIKNKDSGNGTIIELENIKL